MRYLGIDPGTATTGFGIIEPVGDQKDNFKILKFGVIETEKNETDAQRLRVLFTDINTLIQEFKPDVVGVEKLFFTSNQTTAITVAQARGVVLLASASHSLPIIEFTPLQVKSILCGYGKADKKQVQTMVQKTFKLKSLPTPDDASDALAIALCTAWQYKKSQKL